jgi:predicted MFS family arabinose efflux permease
MQTQNVPFTDKQEKLIVALLTLMNFAHILDFVIMMPLGPKLIHAFHIDAPRFGILVSAYAFAAAISGLLGAFVIDRFDRKHALIVLFSGFTIGTFLCAIAWNYWFMLFARIVAGGFGGILGGVVLSIIGDLFPPERRGTPTGVVMSAFSVASVVGIPIGLKAADLFGWQSPFYMIAAICAVIIPFAGRIFPSVKGHHQHASLHWFALMKAIFANGKHWIIFSFLFMVVVGGFSVIPYLPIYLVENAGLASEHLFLVYFIGGCFTFFTSRWIGRLSDRYGKVFVFRITASLAILPIYGLTHLPKSSEVVIFTLTTIFMIVVSGRFVPALALITGNVEGRIRGSFMSVNSSVQQMSSGVATMLGGFLAGSAGEGQPIPHYSHAGYLAIGAILISLFLVRYLAKEQ